MKPEPRYKPGERIGGRYQVHKALMGGMGEVYLCLDLETIQPYALKTFQQRYLTEAQRLRRAFEQEVATWVALEKHPNIVRCFWMQVLDNQPFMCLEWIAGEEGKGTDLRGWLRRGPLSLKVALEIAIDVCNGLIHAQAKRPGLVHRDLKPENILMAQGGLAKITDFGLAQIVQAAGLEVAQASDAADSRHSLVGKGGVAGTPAYMAPEQWRGEPLDERTDIYAIGCILYELLTGRSPFVVDFTPTTPQQLEQWLAMMQLAHEAKSSPRLSTQFAPALDELLDHCTAKAPSARPTGLSDLALQLKQIYQKCFVQLPPLRPAADAFNAGDYNNRGVTYHALGQYTQALADYDRASELDPRYASVYSNRGITYRRLQKYEQALTNFNFAIDLDPHEPMVYNNRGIAYQSIEQYPKALLDFSRAIELNPQLVQAYHNRGSVYNRLHQYKQALADFEQAIRLDPNYASAYAGRCTTYRHLQKYEQALDDSSRAIALNPNLAEAYFNQGNLYAELRQYEHALADFSRAIELDPSYARAYVNRGNTYAELAQYKQAEVDFSRAIELAPSLAQAYHGLGALLTNTGRLGQALFYLENAAKLGHTQSAQYAVQIRQMIQQEATSVLKPAQQAIYAFKQADSLEAMRQTVKRFPLLLQTESMMMIEKVIPQQLPPAQRPLFEQHLAWLRQIAKEQNQ